MLRSLRVHWPMVRMTPGSSFGPITIKARMPMSRNSVQEISNMGIPRPAQAALPASTADQHDVRPRRPRSASGQRALNLASGLGALLDRRGRLMVDRFHRRVRFGVGRFLFSHALLE